MNVFFTQLMSSLRRTSFNRRFFVATTVLAFLLVGVGKVGWGQVTLPHHDPFNYTVGQSLTVQSGWTLVNTSTADLLIASGNLSYTGLPTSTGNKIAFGSTGEDVAKAFTQQTSGTVYFSFIINVTSLGSLNTTGGYFLAFNEGTTTTYGGSIWLRQDGTGYDIGINPRTTAANTVWSSGTTTVNTNILVVVAYQIVSGVTNDVVSLWINPSLGGSQPAATLTGTNTLTDLANLNRVLIRQDAATSTPNIEIDELRIGTTWASVTPAASGSTPPTLTAAGGATVDAPFNVTFTEDATWRGAITSITVDGTPLTAGFNTGTAGQITFTPSASVPAGLLQTAGVNKSIVISATGYTNATVSQTIGVGAAAKLAMVTQPAAPAANGAVLATQPAVRVQDQYNNNVTTSTAAITATVGAGTWTIGGTTAQNAVNGTGVATFTNLTATSASSVTGATIQFTSPGLTPVTSGTFNIPAPPPPAPANDLCGSAVTLTVGGGSVAGTTVSATATSPFTDADVWYVFTPTCTGTATIATTQTAQDVDLEVWSAGCPLADDGGIGSGGTGTSLTSESMTVAVTAGNTYYVRAVYWSGTSGSNRGSFNISVTNSVTPQFTLANTGTPAAGFVQQNVVNVTLFGFALTPSACTNTYNFTAASIATSGTATTSDLSNFRIYRDVNSDGAYDIGDELVGTVATLANPLTFATISGQTGLTAARRYILVADVTSGATPGRTFTATLSNANVTATVSVSGTATGNAMTVQGVAPTLTAASGATVDAPFSVTFTDNPTWRSAITGITVDGTALTAGFSTTTAGQIVFTPSASVPAALLQTAGTNKNIVISATGYSNVAVSQTIGVGIANRLGITTQPTAPASNGAALAAQPVVRVQDQYGNNVSSTATITAAAVQGSWTLGGTTALAASGGAATFSGLTATSNTAVTGATIQFTSAPLAPVTSNTFNIPGPDFISINALITPVSENFNSMGTSTGAVIPSGFGLQNGNSGTLSSSVTQEASTGSPTAGGTYNWGQSTSERSLGFMFSGSYNGYNITAKIRNNTGAIINNFTISFDYEQYRRTTTTQIFKLQYSTSLTTGWTDVTGGSFTNIASGTSTYGFSTLVASQAITNLVYYPAASVAPGADVYFRWTLDGSSSSNGVGIDNFSISAATAATPPTLSAAVGATVDNSFNVTFTDDPTWRTAISSITVNGTALTAGYTVSSGQITFDPSASVPANLLQASGSKSIVVNATGYNSATVSQNIGFGVASKLGVSIQPAAPAINGNTLATQPVVRVQDQYNNTITSSSASVTAAANTLAGTWTLGGTLTQTAVNGVATFTGLTATSPDAVTGATIDFSSGSLTAVASNPFNIPQPDFLNMSTIATPVVQNFTSMGTSATATISQGFKASEAIGNPSAPTWSDGANNRAATTVRGGTLAAASTGGIYNWASGDPTLATDRALGFLTSGSYPTATTGNNVGLSVLGRVKNNTGSILSSVTVSFDYEKYRTGTNICNMTFFYSTNGTNWTAVSAGNHTYAADANSTTVVSATATPKSATITGLSIADGSDIYFRWSYASGGSNAQGIGIDNFSITGCRTLSATVASTNSPICNSSNAVFTISGTANATVTYNINSGANQTVTLNGSGTGTVTVTGATSDQTLNFVSVAEGGCTQSISGSSTIVISTVNTWSGLGDGSSWTDAANWSCGVPDGSTNISIASGDVVLNTNFTIPTSRSLTLSGTATLTVNPTVTLTITGTANFGNRPVTLRSTAGNNAGAIGVIGNNGANLTNATAVTVERFIPAGRKWRGLSSALSSASAGNSIFNSWQNNGAVIAGQGLLLWNTTATGGYSLNTSPGASANIRGYSGGVFTIPASTTGTNLFASGKPVPYMVFVTDSYKTGTNSGNMATGSTATTLRATGTLFAGDYQTGTLSSGYHMIPNPYPHPITLTNTILAGVNDQFWVWDPKLAGSNGYGGYVTTSAGISVPIGGTGSYATNSRVIPAGSAFWVLSTGSGSLTLNESSKTGTGFNIFGRTTGNPGVLRLNLANTAGDQLYDGVAVAFESNTSAGLDAQDAMKFSLGTDNLSIRRSGKDLAIEFRPPATSADTIFLQLHNLKQAAYRFEFSSENLSGATGATALLKDRYLGTETPLLLGSGQQIGFQVDGNAASAGNRFYIVFRAGTVTPVVDLNGVRGFAVYPNPVPAGSPLQVEFRNRVAGTYQFVLYSSTGVQVAQRVVQHGGGTAVQSVQLPQQLPAGMYIAEFTDAKGGKQQLKINIQ